MAIFSQEGTNGYIYRTVRNGYLNGQKRLTVNGHKWLTLNGHIDDREIY
jgi:hypothetical protein